MDTEDTTKTRFSGVVDYTKSDKLDFFAAYTCVVDKAKSNLVVLLEPLSQNQLKLYSVIDTVTAQF